ncbi:MAG: division/cell wall cluster transcriptional repressor MraZ [Alphaproteobacteria bacterium]
MQPFVSTVTNKLDVKGRVSVPAPFRQILAAQDTAGIYCLPSFSHPALEGFGNALMQDVQERLNALDAFFSEEHDARAQVILASSRFLAFDDEGRVTLSEELIHHAHIEERVTFVGLGRKFQIWDPERFAPVERMRIELARKSRS